jgi:hypothetical protein
MEGWAVRGVVVIDVVIGRWFVSAGILGYSYSNVVAVDSVVIISS